MIIVKLWGGLGNQMFQYADGRHLSLKNKTSLVLDLSRLTKTEPVSYTKRDFELDVFNIRYKKKIYTDQLSYAARTYRKLFTKTVHENGNQFNPDVLSQKGNVVLNGFWQTEKYFSDIGDIIRQDFTFKQTPDAANSKLLDEIKGTNSVSVHFRRGDYINNPVTAEVHETCSPAYYQTAMDLVGQKVKDTHFFVFSDEIEWVRKNVEITGKHTFVDVNKGVKSAGDMRLMAACKSNIIANSSFSWWGAWLNPNPNKIIIAPKKWFKDTAVAINDLIPPNWITL